MSGKDYLALAAGTIGYLLGMFGGALVANDPPLHPVHPAADLGTGVAKFAALFVLLLIGALVRTWNPPRARFIWIAIAVVGFGGFLYSFGSYRGHMDSYSFEWPSGDSVLVFATGKEMTPRADSIYREVGGTHSDLVAGFGGLDFVTRVWPEASIDEARAGFEWRYIALLASLSTALFALIEGVFVGKD